MTIGDDLGDHGVEVRRNGFTLGYPRVHTHAGTRRNPEAFNQAWGRSKTAVGVLGIQPNLNRVTGAARALPFQTTAPRNVNLKLHQVEPGRAFGNRMLNLQTGIHFHEPEAMGLRFVEKLHGAGIAVSSGLAQTNRGFAYRLIFLLRERRGG